MSHTRTTHTSMYVYTCAVCTVCMIGGICMLNNSTAPCTELLVGVQGMEMISSLLFTRAVVKATSQKCLAAHDTSYDCWSKHVLQGITQALNVQH